MTEPWLDELDNAQRTRRGCGCSTRATIILIGVVLALIVGCFLGNILIERYHRREQLRQQMERQERIPTPSRSTPVVVPPAGGQVVPTPVRSGG